MILRMLVVCVFFVAATVGAQVQIPDTLAAKQFIAWLESFNAADRARREQFLTEHFPSRPRNIEQDLAVRAQTGGFELVRIEATSETRISGLLKERDSDQFGRFTLVDCTNHF